MRYEMVAVAGDGPVRVEFSEEEWDRYWRSVDPEAVVLMGAPLEFTPEKEEPPL